MKILVIGHVAYDFTCNIKEFPAEDSKTHFVYDNACVGGFGGNASSLLGKYGVETYLASATGDDTYANLVRDELKNNLVHIDSVETIFGARTSLALILNTGHKRTVLSVDKEPLFKKKNDIPIEPDILLVDGYDYNMTLSTLDRFSSKISIFDADEVNDATLEICKRANYIICSKAFAEKVTGTKADIKNSKSLVNIYTSLLSKFPERVIVVTLDAGGALYMVENQIRVMPGLKVDVKDTTGAGDFFRAGFTYALSQRYDIEKCVTFANVIGGLSTRILGGTSSMPDLSEVNSYLVSKYEVKQNVVGNK